MVLERITKIVLDPMELSVVVSIVVKLDCIVLKVG